MHLPDPRELASHGDVSRNFSEILGRFDGEDAVGHVLVVSHSKIVAAIVPIDRYRELAGGSEAASGNGSPQAAPSTAPEPSAA